MRLFQVFLYSLSLHLQNWPVLVFLNRYNNSSIRKLVLALLQWLAPHHVSWGSSQPLFLLMSTNWSVMLFKNTIKNTKVL